MPSHYEDLETGDTFETSTYTLTREEIKTFAAQFDPQPFHTDEEAAKDSMFGELVASSLHTLCISAYLVVSELILGESGIASMGGFGMDDLRWHDPVYPDDTLHVEVEVLGKTPSNSRTDRGYVDFYRRVFNENGEEVLSMVVKHVIERQASRN